MIPENDAPSTPSTISAHDDCESDNEDLTCPLSPKSMNDLADHNVRVNDLVINASQQLLKHQFTNVTGLVDTLVVAACKMDISDLSESTAIQIIFDSVRKHWLTVTNQDCLPGHINIYCSLQLIPSPQCVETICRLFKFQTRSLTLDVLNTHRQTGTVDCGLFAVAYADMLARKQDPCNAIFDQSRMRAHLSRCLKNQNMETFPLKLNRSPRRRVIRTKTETLFCCCRSMYTAGDPMIQCDQCSEWYHQQCLVIDDNVFEQYSQQSVNYKCPKCSYATAENSKGTQNFSLLPSLLIIAIN